MATMELQKPMSKEPQQQQPNKTLETPSFLTEEDDTKKLQDSEEIKPSPTTEAVLTSSGSNSGSAIDLQKRIRRAERFGTPVQLSEEEKRNSRAERFGTAPISHESDGLNKSEELKRKARAERFGLPVQSVSDEEEKKKARLARFASSSKTSSVEEDKMKARAARFSQATSSTANSEKEKDNLGTAGIAT